MKSVTLSTAALALIAATTFTSCSVRDYVEDDVLVRFTATVGENTAIVRTVDNSWVSGDAIGLFMIANNTAVIAEGAENRQYTATAGTAATFTAVSGDEIYYPMNGSPVDFIAYYPWKTDVSYGSDIDILVATVQTSDNQPTFDLLYAKADNGGSGYTKTYNDNVVLEFEHKLVKFVMNTSANDNVGSSLTGMTVTIKGMYTVNTFDLISGTLNTAVTPADITPRQIVDGSRYDAIIMPGSYMDETVSVEFTINSGGNSETFTWTLEGQTFNGGSQYTYNVVLSRTGIQVTGTIVPWDEQPDSDVDAI